MKEIKQLNKKIKQLEERQELLMDVVIMLFKAYIKNKG